MVPVIAEAAELVKIVATIIRNSQANEVRRAQNPAPGT